MEAKEIVQELYEKKDFFMPSFLQEKFHVNEKEAQDIINKGLSEGIFYEVREGEYDLKAIFEQFVENSKEYTETPIYDRHIQNFDTFIKEFFVGKGLEDDEESQTVLMSKFSAEPFAEKLLKNIDIINDKHGVLWRYDKTEGIWKPKAEQYLRTIIRKKLLGQEQQKKNYVDEIISYVKDISSDESFEIDNDPYIIGFKNGVFDLRENKFKNFSPEYHITNKINIEIDENIQECPKIDKFFEDCVGEDYKELLYDLFSYCLFKRYPYPKIFFIYGPASTGKSKFLELLENFLGQDNFCSVEPQDIQKDPHSTAQMQYKMANIVSDINYNALDNINQVKKITGEDTVKIRNMYREPYNGKIFAKQIFSTNKLPIVKEKTKAWYRRVYTIEFPNIIQKSNADRFLMERLLQEAELKGLAYKCLEKLKELKEWNFTFTYDIDEKAMQEIYEQLSNPILMFTDQECKADSNSFLFQWEFKERLKYWLKANHFPPISNSEINKYMNENWVNSNRNSPDGEKTYRVWGGLTWKDNSEKGDLNHFNHFNRVAKKVYINRGIFEKPVKSVNSVKES